MNLHQPNANDALQTRNRSRDIAPQSGICSRCLDGCKGNCDMFQATFRGRELLYPQPFGSVTAGADKDYPVDYSHLNIMGYALGAKGVEPDPDQATFPNVNSETSYGISNKVKMKVPIFTEQYWKVYDDKSPVPPHDLAMLIDWVRKHPPKKPLPKVTGLTPKQRLALEDDFNQRCIDYARANLPL